MLNITKWLNIIALILNGWGLIFNLIPYHYGIPNVIVYGIIVFGFYNPDYIKDNKLNWLMAVSFILSAIINTVWLFELSIH